MLHLIIIYALEIIYFCNDWIVELLYIAVLLYISSQIYVQNVMLVAWNWQRWDCFTLLKFTNATKYNLLYYFLIV